MAETDSNPQLISRKDSGRLGLKHFFTGKPCKRGHLSRRLVSTGQCCECLYVGLRDWRRKNRESARERDRAWKAKNRESIRENERIRYHKNPEKFRAKVRNQYAKNPEPRKQYSKKYYWDNYEYVSKKARVRTKKWAAENRERARANARNGKAKRKRGIGSHTADDVAKIFKAQRGRCAICTVSLSKTAQHVDHIVPLSKNGSNDRRNLQILCEDCNLKKGARDPIDHMRFLGKLL